MELYFELQKTPVFTIDDVNLLYGNIESARSAVKRLVAKGLVEKIRNNMYTCISGETESPIANRYQIACALTPTAFISHHTAAEYYGIQDQVFYEVYVSSETRFNDFEFDGYTYRYVASKCTEGIETVKYSGGIRITDRERTLIDSIKDMEKIAGIEEVLAIIEKLSDLNEEKLLRYLDCYQNQFLYQKTGFLLKHYQQQCGVSDNFFKTCIGKKGLSKRYLTKECKNGKYNVEWGLVVPKNLFSVKNGGY